MKKLSILTIAPVLALIGVSCSGPNAMQATEYDDLYYSSSDRTEYAQPAEQTYDATASAAEEQQVLSESEVLNPEYSESRASIDNYDGDEYYDGRDYNPRNNWYRPNYSFVDPYWASAVHDPWYPSYSRYNPYGRYSPYGRYGHAFYDPFYDPFLYDPFYRPHYGSAFSISIGLGYGWGGYPYHGYGYSRWPYNSYYNNFYNGYYGGRHNYYNNYYYYDRPYVNQRKVQYGPRDQRAVIPATGDRNAGRPDRGQQSVTDEQRVVSPGTTADRPARPSRTTRGDVTPGTNTREALPARPNPTENTYRRTERSTRGSVDQQPAIQQQQREVRPAQPQERTIRRRESVPSVERSQPVRQQRTERAVESRPSYEQPRREYNPPSYEPRRESSSPAPSNNSGGGGRPRRGN